MTKSQADVDKVMAAFGAAPIKYRASQERTGAAPAPGAMVTDLSPRLVAGERLGAPQDRVDPSAGGPVRDIFPLIARAVPQAADLSVNAAHRPGDKLPEQLKAQETAAAEQAADEAFAARLRGEAAQAAQAAAAAAPTAPSALPPQVPSQVAIASDRALSSVEAAAQPAITVPEPPEPAPSAGSAPLRSHADLIRRLGGDRSEAPDVPAAAMPAATVASAAPIPVPPLPPQPVPQPPPAIAFPAAPMQPAPMQAAPIAPAPMPMPPAPPGAYPVPPAYAPPPVPAPYGYPAMGWPPPPGYPPPMPPGYGYPPAFPPYGMPPQAPGYGYAPPYGGYPGALPPGYPPPAYPYPAPEAPAYPPAPPQGAAPPPAPAPSAPSSLSDIFAAMQGDREKKGGRS
ncbi:hypothetical protein [Acidisoma sp. 7E03]